MTKAICIFGSVLREDYDSYSDKDILIVSDNLDSIKSEILILESNKWSVSKYTWKKLDYVINNKSLFVQHIKRESKILLDTDDVLKDTLSRYVPLPSYNLQFEETKHLFLLLERISNNPIVIGWALDLLFTSFRNLSIFFLANEGIYTFSHKKIVSYLKQIKNYSYSDIEFFIDLRKYRYYYHKQFFSKLPSLDSFFEILDSVNQLYKIGLHSRVCNDDDYFEWIIGLLLKGELDYYQKFRLVENLVKNNRLMKYLHESENSKLKKIISDPQNQRHTFIQFGSYKRLLDNIGKEDNIVPIFEYSY
jgi:predicted nucleotidyltransferase